MRCIKFFTLFFILTVSTSLFAQVSYNTFVASIMNQVSADSVYKYERQLCGDTSCVIGGSTYTIPSRYYTTPGNIKSSQYIYERFQSFGLTPWYQNITATMINVLAKKTGNKYPNQYVIICAHYDDMPSGATAPGADDNASGTIAVVEAARLLANVNLPYTIIFAAWDEEERGLYGSQAYADTAFAHGDSIIAVLNFDMIAYDGNADGALDVNTNAASTPLANDFAQIVSLYQPTLVPQVTTSLSGGSDHQSFQARGYKAILSIEDNSDFTPYYHTVNDTYASLNKPYFVKMIKAGIAALVTIAGDFKITIQHTPITTSPGTGPRTATAVIKSSYKIAAGVNQPRLYYNVNGGSFNYLNPSYTNLDTFKFTIPGQPMNTTVSYYIAAQDSAGTLAATLPAGGSGVNPPGTTPPVQKFEYQVANLYIVTIGNGTVSSDFPFTTYWMDGRTQFLYTASEINMGNSSISQIAFDVINADPGPMNNFKVSFQNTSLTSLTGFVTTGWTTCYSPSSYTVPGTGWQTINLSTPFAYTGGNLLVQICYNNSSYTLFSTVNSTASTGMYWGRYGDLSTGDGCATTSWTQTAAPPGRANTRFSLTPAALSLNLTALIQGFYNGTTMVPDTVTVELHNTTAPYALVESNKVMLNTAGTASPSFTTAVNGTPYYIVLKHRNSIETWSSTPQTFSSSSLSYDFTIAATQAYGNNMTLVGTKWCIISGDVNQDGSIDALDRSSCWNDRNLSGYYSTDLNGDGVVDALDRSIAWNNRNLSVQKPALEANPISGVKQDKNNSKGTYELKLDGSNAKKVIKNK